MCGRTSLFTPLAELEARFDATAVEPFPPRYNIAPGEDLAVIRNDALDDIGLARWGLIPGWVDDVTDWPRPINARAETLSEKPSFRDAFERRRCLVLADGFYEWQRRPHGKRPYRVALDGDAPFAMAGLWERWGDDDAVTTCTVVTTDANDLVAPIHDRMPVLLAPDEERTWLESDDADERRTLMDPYDGDDLVAYPISTAVNDPTYDSPGVIERDGGGQTGLDAF
ncbi:MAG: SOS response-associated peptidase [Halobacteriota archaeon]